MYHKRKVNKVDDNGNIIESYNSIFEAEDKNGIPRSSINKALLKKYKSHGFYWQYADIKIEKISEPDEIYVTEEQLHQRHDMTYKINQELEKIPKGSYIEESRLLKKIGILGKSGYRAVISHPDFQKYRGKVDGIVNFGNPESIEKNKMKGLLS